MKNGCVFGGSILLYSLSAIVRSLRGGIDTESTYFNKRIEVYFLLIWKNHEENKKKRRKYIDNHGSWNCVDLQWRRIQSFHVLKEVLRKQWYSILILCSESRSIEEWRLWREVARRKIFERVCLNGNGVALRDDCENWEEEEGRGTCVLVVVWIMSLMCLFCKILLLFIFMNEKEVIIG